MWFPFFYLQISTVGPVALSATGPFCNVFSSNIQNATYNILSNWLSTHIYIEQGLFGMV